MAAAGDTNPLTFRMSPTLRRSGLAPAIRLPLALFQVERYLFLAVTLISVLTLLGCATFLLLTDPDGGNIGPIVGLFGSAGGITYSTGRLLRMWSDAIRMLGMMPAEGDDE